MKIALFILLGYITCLLNKTDAKNKTETARKSDTLVPPDKIEQPVGTAQPGHVKTTYYTEPLCNLDQPEDVVTTDAVESPDVTKQLQNVEIKVQRQNRESKLPGRYKIHNNTVCNALIHELNWTIKTNESNPKKYRLVKQESKNNSEVSEIDYEEAANNSGESEIDYEESVNNSEESEYVHDTKFTYEDAYDSQTQNVTEVKITHSLITGYPTKPEIQYQADLEQSEYGSRQPDNIETIDDVEPPDDKNQPEHIDNSTLPVDTEQPKNLETTRKVPEDLKVTYHMNADTTAAAANTTYTTNRTSWNFVVCVAKPATHTTKKPEIQANNTGPATIKVKDALKILENNKKKYALESIALIKRLEWLKSAYNVTELVIDHKVDVHEFDKISNTESRSNSSKFLRSNTEYGFRDLRNVIMNISSKFEKM